MSEQELWEKYVEMKWGGWLNAFWSTPRWELLHRTDWDALERIDAQYTKLRILYV